VADRGEIFAIHLAGKPVASDVNADDLAHLSESFTGADIEAVCRRAATLTLRAHLPASADVPVDTSALVITAAAIQSAIEHVKTSTMASQTRAAS
jgi:transitional endoplasmic reticulum ATPase